MKAWQSSKLEALPVQIIDGDRSARYPKRGEFREDGFLFLNTTNIEDYSLRLDQANFVSAEKFEQINKGRLRRFDVVMTTRGSIGKVALFNCAYPTGLINAQMLILRADGKIIDPRFLFYLLRSNAFQKTLKNFASGSAQPQIPIQDLRAIEVKYPPLPVQRAIAAILSAYDDLIENNTRRIKILEKMAQAIYREWFVHFRFPGHEKVKLVNSPVGQIPAGWETKNLGDVCGIVMGQSPKSEFYNERGEGLPFHQGVTDFGLNFPEDRVYCTVQNRIAECGDILFSVRAPVGRINVTLKRIVIGRGLCAIRNRQGNQTFTLHQLKERFAEEDTMGGGTIFKAVTKDDMQGIGFLQPDGRVVQRFEEACGPAEKLIQSLTQKNANLRTTRDLLLPKLISGEVDVSDLDIKTADEAA